MIKIKSFDCISIQETNIMDYSDSLQAGKIWCFDPHYLGMPYLWSFTIDLAIFFILYKYRLAWVFMHALVGFGIGFLTLLFAFPMLILNGIPPVENALMMRRHKIMGTSIIAVIFLQVLLGMTTNILKQFRKSSPLIIFIIKNGHKYLGYSLLILSKLQIYLTFHAIGDRDNLYYTLLIADMILIVAFIVRKLWYSNMGNTIMMNYEQKNIRNVNSIQELQISENQPFGVFGNYIFNLKTLLKFHPAGYKLIEGIKYRDLDRYLYGMYRTERDPKIPPNVHSSKALILAGDPVAKLNIPQLYRNMEGDYCDVALKRVSLISQRGGIYQVELQSATQPFEYLGYQFVHQLGRFYSLTLDKKVTRLYTNVGFLDTRNVIFMEKMVLTPMGITLRHSTTTVKSIIGQQSQTNINNPSKLVLLLKKYDTGKLTKSLINDRHKGVKLQLSCSRGEGLHFGQHKPGKIIIVAGGTGLFPFCDLIDLLFKNLLLQTKPQLKADILKNDPILKTKPFADFNFMFYLAVNSTDDIHPLTLAQLNELTKHPKLMKLMLKVSKQEEHQLLNQNVAFTKQRFSSILDKSLLAQVYQRIWVCGPPVMNEDMVLMFDRFNIPPQKYLIL